MRIIFLITLLTAICFFSCENYVPAEPKSFSLMMFRGNCLGTCPIYSLNVESDGNVVFEGTAYTQTIGKAESRLSNEKIKELIVEINKANFFSFQDEYSYNSKNCSQITTDTPKVFLTIKIDDKEKTIHHYHGCYVKDWFSKENALQPLTDLENKIDEIVETKRWVGEIK